jgi:hypothetical protein
MKQSDFMASKRSERAAAVNALELKELDEIVTFMLVNKITGTESKYVELREGYWRCNLKCTVDRKGQPKYPQIDINRFGFKVKGKQLVHLIWWRWETGGQLIDPTQQISHRHYSSSVLSLVQESVMMNESRKYCHLFGWFKTFPEEDKPRCPHLENPCQGDCVIGSE